MPKAQSSWHDDCKAQATEKKGNPKSANCCKMGNAGDIGGLLQAQDLNFFRGHVEKLPEHVFRPLALACACASQKITPAKFLCFQPQALQGTLTRQMGPTPLNPQLGHLPSFDWTRPRLPSSAHFIQAGLNQPMRPYSSPPQRSLKILLHLGSPSGGNLGGMGNMSCCKNSPLRCMD